MNDDIKKSIYEEYHKKVLWYMFSKLGDNSVAEDLCEDVFVKIYEKLDSFDSSKASLSTWIFTISRNRLIDYYRVRKVNDEISEEISDESDIEEAVCNKEMLDMLADALAGLDKRERDLIVLHYYSGCTLKETAQKLGISYAYVKILHNKALGELKQYMA